MTDVLYPDKEKNKEPQYKTLAQKRMEEIITGYTFLAPAMIIFIVFLVLPIAFAFFISFTDWNGISPLGQTQTGAAGEVEFTNETADPVTVPAGTAVIKAGKDGIRYLTQAEVQVPANGTALVAVAADPSQGKDTNAAKSIVKEIEGPLADVLKVKNPAAITGGLDDSFKVNGLDNYNRLLFKDGLAQQDFFTAFKNTLYFVLGVVPVQTILALLLAVVLNQKWLKARGVFRTVYYFPSITSSVVISLIFMWMFSRSGIVNVALSALFPNYEPVTWLNDSNGLIHNFLGLFGITRQTVGAWASTQVAGLTLWEWISGPSVTMFTIMMLNTWTTIGTLMVIFLAALQNISPEVYEAAQIDGATTWQTFRKITVPLLAPTTFFVVTLGLIGTFQVFDQVFVISSGGPAKTTLTIAYIVYQSGFKNSEMGLAAASAIILFAIIFVFTMIQRRITTDRAA
jgi:multiple sugar transport system permease protein